MEELFEESITSIPIKDLDKGELLEWISMAASCLSATFQVPRSIAAPHSLHQQHANRALKNFKNIRSEFCGNAVLTGKHSSAERTFTFRIRAEDDNQSPVEKLTRVGVSNPLEKVKQAVASTTNGHLPFTGEDEPRRGSHGKPLFTTSAGTPVSDDNLR